MRQILAMLAVFSTILASSGCGDIRTRVADGALMKEGVLKGGLNFKEPVVKVEKGAIQVEKGAIQVEKGAFQGPALKIEPKAVNLQIASGAIQFHENAVNINLGKRKGPYIDAKQIKEQLDNLGPLGDLKDLPEDQRNKILSNEAIYQMVIKSLMKMIGKYNRKYADPPKDDK